MKTEAILQTFKGLQSLFGLVIASLVFAGVAQTQESERDDNAPVSQAHQHDHGATGHTESDLDQDSHGSGAKPTHQHEDNHVNASVGHNHATDHRQNGSAVSAVSLLGKFHPMVVHFPIALLLAAALSEVISLVKKEPRISAPALYCLVMGTVGAVIGAPLGWANAWGAQYPETMAGVQVLTVHRILGTAGAAAALACLALGFRTHRASDRKTIVIFRGALVMTAILIGAAGHFGAMLVFGLDYFIA